MEWSRPALGVCGTLFLAVALSIVVKQRRSKMCDLHRNAAGSAAIALAILCGLVGGVSVFLALTLG